ncbi:ABC transporter substrate-binding protein [Treponema pedis]|uniref:ABC transporter substrate-binding protein n=1 Tax=Treponema pedis TaxID=409322 RepID=A0A7S6WN50_9SPIR|nr:ABC transporter substrate-binding protein [Treponema pedis]QOW60220.1 ABC transporter substrate-binding protein [Treponema pedis]
MNNYFNLTDTVFEVTEKYPQLIPYFVKKGFTPLNNPIMRKMMGKKISIEKALLSKKLDTEKCEAEMCAVIKTGTINTLTGLKKTDINSAEMKDGGKRNIRIEGVLPCPIKIPLLEKFEEFYSEYKTENEEKLKTADYKITYDLRSANLGIDWICEQVKTGKKENLPDILLSAGFELFFDKNLMGRFIEDGTFNCKIEKMNKDFCNADLDLRDGKNNYAIIGAVPAIMIVNTEALNGRKPPETWQDLLKDEFENSVALPFQDLDLFNAVILTVYKIFGDEGVQKLAGACGKFLHPAQMVKGKKESVPAINIAPFFFSKMIKENSALKAVWPKDGAIIAPIFMLVKTENAEITKPFADFFLSEKTGNIFAQSGFFPSTNPNVNNNLSADKKFIWVGWDFLHNNDIGLLLEKLRKDFETAALRK